MNTILSFLREEHDSSVEKLFACFHEVAARGDIFIIKVDGMRTKDKYTVVISSPTMAFTSIRYDTDDIIEGARKALYDYIYPPSP